MPRNAETFATPFPGPPLPLHPAMPLLPDADADRDGANSPCLAEQTASAPLHTEQIASVSSLTEQAAPVPLLTKERLGVVLLAAGASSRMGEPKQLLRWHGQSLIRRATLAALALESRAVVVVLGANADRIAPELDWLPVQVAVNSDWQAGMASSLCVGLDSLERISPPADAVLLTLADQPLVTAPVLARLIAAFRASSLPIAAAQYGDVIGVPAIFAREMLPALQNLSGDTGARKVIAANLSRVVRVSLPEAAHDIDTPDAYARLASHSAAPPLLPSP